MEKFVSALPLTEAEQTRDQVERREVLEKGLARKTARRSGQRYDKPMTPAIRQRTNATVGSE
jgi:hypothetical protein